MNVSIVRATCAAAFLMGGLSLVGCSASRGAGMATTLEPGQQLDIVAVGEDASVRLANEGPGSVTISSEAAGSRSRAELRLGVRGVTDLPAPAGGGGGTFRVFNRSTEPAAVRVDVTGAQAVDIKGPVVGSTAK